MSDNIASNNVLDEVVSVFLAYRQSRYLDKTLTSAMNQTVFPSKLIVMDDASPDDSDQVFQRILKNAPVGLNIDYQRNDKNIGLIAQLNKLVNAYDDKLIVLQAGDDESYPNRLEETYRAWIQNGKPSLVLANYDGINEAGDVVEPFADKKPQKPYTLERLINRRAMVYGCCAAIHSDLFNFYGTIPTNVVNEDRVNAFRAYFRHGIHYIHKPLLRYRLEGGISSFSKTTRDERLQKLKTEARRESADIECHLKDLQKLPLQRGVKRRLFNRLRYVVWVSSLGNRSLYLDFLIGMFRGGRPDRLVKTLKRLRD